MNSHLLFSFDIDRETNTVHVQREFSAGVDLVWEAWTNPEILDQWWAPKPYQSVTKHMEFKVGGWRFYAMMSPENELVAWCLQDYTTIDPKTRFTYFNAFADENENPDLPGSDWEVTFSENNGTTIVNVTIYNESRERMEEMIKMGFREGFTLGLEQLEELVKNQK